jgi:hypothetical protein
MMEQPSAGTRLGRRSDAGGGEVRFKMDTLYENVILADGIDVNTARGVRTSSMAGVVLVARGPYNAGCSSSLSRLSSTHTDDQL